MFLHEHRRPERTPCEAGKFYGNAELDRKLLPFLEKIRYGVFLEAGANNGVSQSNTLYLEKNLGWTGVLVEPVPRLAREARLNRTARVVNAALVGPDYKGRSVKITCCNLMSVTHGSLPPDVMARHIADGEAVQEVTAQEKKVAARTLRDVLTQQEASTINLLVLDIEGNELEALRGYPFEIRVPDWIMIEVKYNREAIHAFLRRYCDFVTSLTEQDDLFKSKSAAIPSCMRHDAS